MIDLSVVLITWNSEAYVTACLDSVCSSTAAYSREIVIVDNGSTDSTRALIEPYTHLPYVTFIPQKYNMGISRARNVGIKHSTGEFVWLLDIDTVVNERCIKEMMDLMNVMPDCGICGCKLMNDEGEIQYSCRKFPSFRYKMYNLLDPYLKKYKLAPALREEIDHMNRVQFYRSQLFHTSPFVVDYVIGACQLVLREVFQQVGMYDEHIFYGPEDADLCLRAKRVGWTVYYLPQVAMMHKYQRITNKQPFSTLGMAHTSALIYYFIKHSRFWRFLTLVAR